MTGWGLEAGGNEISEGSAGEKKKFGPAKSEGQHRPNQGEQKLKPRVEGSRERRGVNEPDKEDIEGENLRTGKGNTEKHETGKKSNGPQLDLSKKKANA